VDGGRYGLALTAGMLATVNPCGLPMLPAYLGFFISDGSDDDRSPFAAVLRAIVVALTVALGFVAVFAVAGGLVSWVTHDVYEITPWVTVVVGVVLIGLGIFMLTGRQLRIALPHLDRGGRSGGLGSMFVFGVSYAIASVSCTLPVFLAQVSTTLGTDVARGILVFGAFALGMALVLVALSVSLALARTEIVHALRRSLAVIGRVAGGFLVVAGAYLAWYGVYEIRDSVSNDPAIDRVTGWSADLGNIIDGRSAFAIAALLIAAIVAVLAVAYVRSARESRSSSSSSP
jgi:cytochrome c biogenesis protein CcdA